MQRDGFGIQLRCIPMQRDGFGMQLLCIPMQCDGFGMQLRCIPMQCDGFLEQSRGIQKPSTWRAANRDRQAAASGYRWTATWRDCLRNNAEGTEGAEGAEGRIFGFPPSSAPSSVL